jgi:hypothetical protein
VRVVSTLALPAALILASISCRQVAAPPPLHPLILFGVDGADWAVIERMWQAGRLPQLKRLADRGVAAPLETFHHASPVIWTTVATGVMPEVHGISEFVVPTERGDQPVSSTLRRVPALWNMLTASNRKVAVVGWWATWPAEQVSGVLISDRAVHEIPDRVWPPEHLEESGAEASSMLESDRILSRAAIDLAGEAYDLVMLYLRGVDISCHFHWRGFEPDGFPAVEPGVLENERELIFREYELVDRTLGDLLGSSDRETNVIVISDHGFEAMDGETTHIRLNFDIVLERLGFLVRDGNGYDLDRSELYSYASPERSLVKKIRFAGGATRTATRNRLEMALSTVTYAGGAPAFQVRDATAKEEKQGADFCVDVLADGAKKPLMTGGRPVFGAIHSISRLSGTHGRETAGIFIAAGPDIAPRAGRGQLRVIDVPPTVLYALGLPSAEDFAGRALTELFTESFRNARRLHTIPTWGKPTDGENRASAVDDELVEQLRALGYVE